MSDRIRSVREEKGWTQTQLGDAVGVSRAAVSQWENGETKGLKPENLVKTSEVLGVNVKWLATGKGPMRDNGVNDIATEYAPGLKQVPPDTRRIPVISYIQAGDPKRVIDDYSLGQGFTTIGIDQDMDSTLGPNAFALQIEGESMLPDFKPGDLVIVDPESSVRPGDIVVAKIAGEEAATIKKYRSRGKDENDQPIFELVPLNDDYPTIVINAGNPGEIIGPIVEHRRRFR